MKKYPRFLKSMPNVLGLSFPELGIIVFTLWLCLVFNYPPYYALVMALIGILLSKLVKKNFDLVGFLAPRKKDTYLTDFRKEEE